MQVLVDTSVWIDYFKSGIESQSLDLLINENLVVINEVILAELVPSLRIKQENKVIRLLGEVRKLPLAIDWQEVIEMQVKSLRVGINGVGIPDLVIAQNATQHQAAIYSLDKHFNMLEQSAKIKLFQAHL